jgi:hypothetical protein
VPRQIVHLSIFVSCPDNLGAERDIVCSALPEINRILEASYGVTLDILDWRGLVPGVGVNAQDVVNSQVDNSYDIYLGILGSRFGTSTASAGSGTEEEFDHTYQSYVLNPSKVRILFYFKDSLQQGVQTLDLDQLRRVHDFRAKLKNAGVLYAQFANSDEFLKLVKEHLINLITKQWDKNKWRVLSQAIAPVTSTLPEALTVLGEERIEPIEDPTGDASDQMPGLDALILSTENLNLAAGAGVRIGKLVDGMGASMQKATQETQASLAGSAPLSPQRMKVLINTFAKDLHEFALQLRGEVAAFRSAVDTGLGAFERVIDFQMSELHTELIASKEAYGELSKHSGGIRASRDLIQQFRDQIGTLPDYTSALRRSKREVAASLDEFQAAVTIMLDRMAGIEQKLDTRDSTSS